MVRNSDGHWLCPFCTVAMTVLMVEDIHSLFFHPESGHWTTDGSGSASYKTSCCNGELAYEHLKEMGIAYGLFLIEEHNADEEV